MHRMWLFLPSQTVTDWKKSICRPRFTRAFGKFVDPIMEYPQRSPRCKINALSEGERLVHVVDASSNELSCDRGRKEEV